MFSNMNSFLQGAISLTLPLAFAFAAPATAQDANAAEATYAEVAAVMGGLPTFVKAYPKAGIAGAWALTRDLEFADTALDAKTKALIGLAVAAQIPCNYCIWSDTEAAKAAGATDQQIAEAVGISALTRHWSTVFNGLQIDFDQFKAEMGGEMAAQ